MTDRDSSDGHGVGRSAPYCAPQSLAYERSRWVFQQGVPLTFDETYRVAHLPLVAREHPAVIPAAKLDYEWGRYDRARYSLIAPVDISALSAGLAFQSIERDIRSRSFAHKIAWDMVRRRASKLHVTVAGGLREADLEACASAVREALRGKPSLRYRLGGPFVGTKNTGRIYFTTYPEATTSGDVFAMLQDALGIARTGFYVLGYYNLLDELNVGETADLADFLATWREATVAESSTSSLCILATHDDLALDSQIVRRSSMGG